MTLPEMPCQEIVEVITEYLEGTLPEPDRARFEAHLATCGPCAQYLEQMRITIAALRGLEEEIPVEDREQLLTLFRDWKGSSD
jgi:anti-sigma factor RsiW